MTLEATAQDFPFTRNFVSATIILKDSKQKTGFVKWNTNQNERLRFKSSINGDEVKYSPSDLPGFQVDTLKYKSLFDLEVYAENYPLLGKTSKLKQTFGQILHQGKINIYLTAYHGYEAMSGAGIFLNIVFEKLSNGRKEYTSYPILMRMKDKKYEAAKDRLYSFFADYPLIVEKIKQYNQRQDFFEVISLIKRTL